VAPEAAGEGGDTGVGGLFRRPEGFWRRGGGGRRRRRGAGARQASGDDAFAGDGEAALDQRLEAAGAEDVGEGPAREGEEEFTGAGGEDDAARRGGVGRPSGSGGQGSTVMRGSRKRR
jgi:hypothetical protein